MPSGKGDVALSFTLFARKSTVCHFHHIERPHRWAELIRSERGLQTHHVAPWDSRIDHCTQRYLSDVIPVHSSKLDVSPVTSSQLRAFHPCALAAGAKESPTTLCNAFFKLSPAELHNSIQAALLRVEETSQIRDQPVLCERCKLHYISTLL